MEKYAVASFTDGAISVIPKCWLVNKNLAYWPNNVRNLRTLIVRAEEPNKEWPTHAVMNIFGFYEKYEEAIAMEKQAVKDSSESEAEDRGIGKRKSKPKNIYSPPPSFSSNSSESSHKSNTMLITLDEALSKEVIILPNTTAEVEEVLLDLESTVTNDNVPNSPDGIMSHNNSTLSVLGGIDHNPEGVAKVSNEQLLKKLEDIDKTLKFILLRLNVLETPNSSNEFRELDFSGLPPLPLKTLGELLDLEEVLKEKDFEKKMTIAYKTITIIQSPFNYNNFNSLDTSTAYITDLNDAPMDELVFNYSQLALIGTNHGDFTIPDNLSEVNINRSVTRLTSPLAVTIVVLLVFLLSPMILIGNFLVLVSMYRFKRLRTPSNYLVMSLATSDLGVGMFMPVGFYLELNGSNTFPEFQVCLFSYGVVISLCCVSVLVMVAIAVDRFTSLARPLRYNNLITHSAVERYILIFWIYSSLVGFSPLAYAVFVGPKKSIAPDCSFGDMVEKPVQLFMFCAVYGPSSLVLIVCYGYIYFVARGHARAIRTEQQQSVYRHQHYTGTAGPPRYGLALAITTGLFIGLWMPFQICMLLDVFLETNILTSWISIYLALPILTSSAFNPWVYGYRNAELRAGVRRVIDDILSTLGFTYRSHQISDRDQMPPSVAATAGEPASFINHVQRDGVFWKSEGDFLLVPIARPESSGVLSSVESQKFFCSTPKIILPCETPRLMLKNSRSMVESLAMIRGSDILIVRGTHVMKHGSSVL